MTTKWVDGIEYELDPNYPDFDVWIPLSVIDITSSGASIALLSDGVEVKSGMVVEVLGSTYDRNSSIHQMSEGDTPNTILVAGLPLGIAQNMTGDWTCQVEILDYKRDVISPARSITETLNNSDGIESFRAELLIGESALMTNEYTRNRPAGYFWLITVENTAIPYRRTLEIEIAVRKR